MHNLTDLISRYTIRHSDLIRKTCEPLKNFLGIPVFTYYTIDEEGNFTIISSEIEQLEFYYHEKLYLTNNYLNHPRFFRSGYNLGKGIEDPSLLELSQKKFNIGSFFQILQCSTSKMEGFLFAAQNPTTSPQFYLNHLDSLQKFCSYFKRETRDLHIKMKQDKYSLVKAKGELFLQHDPSLPLSKQDPKVLQFSKAINPLSAREQECLELFKLGHSAQSTAALLGLSQRTVEDYFEKIKVKLGCNSKRELLEF